MLFAKKNKTESEVPKKYHIEEVYVLKTYIVSDWFSFELKYGKHYGVNHWYGKWR